MAYLNNGFFDEFVETMVVNKRLIIPGRKYILRRRKETLRDGREQEPEEKSLFECDELILRLVSFDGFNYTFKNPEFLRKIHIECFLGNRDVPATLTPASEWIPLPKAKEPNEFTEHLSLIINPNIAFLDEGRCQLFLLRTETKFLSPTNGPDKLHDVITSLSATMAEENSDLRSRVLSQRGIRDNITGFLESGGKSRRTKRTKKSRRRSRKTRKSRKIKNFK